MQVEYEKEGERRKGRPGNGSQCKLKFQQSEAALFLKLIGNKAASS